LTVERLTILFTHSLLLFDQATILNYCPGNGVHYTSDAVMSDSLFWQSTHTAEHNITQPLENMADLGIVECLVRVWRSIRSTTGNCSLSSGGFQY
jgi:hypothetical protein